MMRKKENGKEGLDYSGLFGSEKSIDEKVQGFGVILEEMNSNMKFVLETIISMKISLEQQLKDLEKRLTAEIRIIQIIALSNKNYSIQST